MSRVRQSALILVLWTTTLLAGCTIHTRPHTVTTIEPAPVVATQAAPARVWYNGRWLYYRSNGYYYYHRGSWRVPRSVPVHVHHHHRPTVRVIL